MSRLKANFSVVAKYEALYTGGRIQISNNGVYMFCGCGNKIQVLDIQTGTNYLALGQEQDEEISTFCLSPDNKYVILATQHLLLRQWNWKEEILVRTWKAIHMAPVVCMSFDVTSTLLATGSADSTVKIWDVEKQYCTHNLRGHQGIVSVVQFHPDISRLQLFSAGEDYKIRVWNLKTSSCIAVVEAHYSIVTEILFSLDGNTVYSCGRDGIVSVWDAVELKVTKTIPVFETLASIALLPDSQELPDIRVTKDAPHFITAGSTGQLRVWNARTSKCVYSQREAAKTIQSEVSTDEPSGRGIAQTLYLEALKAVVSVTVDHNISLFNAEDFSLKKQFAGNNDAILDIKYLGKDESHIVMATNSAQLKVFELKTWGCQILTGHTDTVLHTSVYKDGTLFATTSKDNTVRLWHQDPETMSVSCLGVGQGHTHAVYGVAFSRLKPNFLVTGSEDCTLKIWKIPSDLGTMVSLVAKATERAHDQDINSVAVAPNDKFIATGSKDKTAKLWNVSDLSLLGVMRGHKRGIWCVEFSPVDQCLATSSGDGTIKIWSLTDFSCVKTFEGHDSAVLKVTFISRGMQILSSSSGGLVKLWTIKTNECVKTLDEHQDKVWALAVGREENKFFSAGEDSTVVLWLDCTETDQEEARAKQENFILQEQELSNLMHHKKYLKAIGLAITLEQPFKVLTIIREILSDKDGSKQLQQTIGKLRMDQIDAVLRFAAQWNTNSRNCHEAQFVLSTVLQTYTGEELKKFPNFKSTLEGLLPYTERHFQRMNRLLQQSMFVNYTWHCMRTAVGDDSCSPSMSMVLGAETGKITAAEKDTVADIGMESDTSSDSEDVMNKIAPADTDKKETKEGEVLNASQKEAGPTQATSDEEEPEEHMPIKQTLDTNNSTKPTPTNRKKLKRLSKKTKGLKKNTRSR